MRLSRPLILARLTGLPAVTTPPQMVSISMFIPLQVRR